MRISLMIETGVIPTLRVVTVSTIVPAEALVYVIFLVAREAVIRRSFKHVLLVTIGTLSGFMFTYQGVVGRVVIEGNIQPVRFVMTLTTIFAQLSFVIIVIPMTGETFLRGVSVFVRRFMASVAICFLVLSAQKIIGKLVIER